jgi:hypothetical protein
MERSLHLAIRSVNVRAVRQQKKDEGAPFVDFRDHLMHPFASHHAAP